MAHIRLRHVEDNFSTLMRFSPIVGIFGHRQVGKTTFAAQKAAAYWTLDDEATQAVISSAAARFLRTQKQFPVVVDECQMAPKLFPALNNVT